MSEKENSLRKGNVERSTFDPSNFMSQILASIDDARSDVGSSPNQVVKNTLNLSMGKRVESRLNTFYRLLGFPATRNEENLSYDKDESKSDIQRLLNQVGTLNYFSSGAIGIADVGDIISGRERLLQKTKTSSDFATMIKSPLPLGSYTGGARKPSLFPMVVDAATPIFPMRRRVAPLFYLGDFIISGDVRETRLPRPFLESIIYMRTQVFSGGNADVTQLKEDLKTNVRSSDLENPDSYLTDIDKFNKVELEIISKFVQALNTSAVAYRRTVEEAYDLRTKVNFVPEVKESPEEMTGHVAVIDEEGDIAIVGIDSEIKNLESKLLSIDVSLQSLPTNRVKEADALYRIESGIDISSKNFESDVFVSEFTSLITFEREQLNRSLGEAKLKRQRLLSQYNDVRARIQYFSGETTGLSIFDVLCTFIALFTIDIEHLIGLLNNDARERLKNSRFYSFQNSPDNTSTKKGVIFDGGRADEIFSALGSFSPVSTALKVLQSKVEENFKLAESFYTAAAKAGENRISSPSPSQNPQS